MDDERLIDFLECILRRPILQLGVNSMSQLYFWPIMQDVIDAQAVVLPLPDEVATNPQVVAAANEIATAAVKLQDVIKRVS
jgi:hypothetical protein